MLLFASFPRDGSAVGIKDLARLTGMHPSTTHRYATTLLEVGLVERGPNTRLYRIAQ
ncbi:MAG: helix-turn-helix domain-containing protein [Solirubrobacterales bacterium]|nr:helix-turn-helix domain-containing protein [Solirubrobacterales bacterium]